jgi:hypothetical protein
VQRKQESKLIQKGLYLNDDGLVLCPSCGVRTGTFYLTTLAHCTLIPLPMVASSTAVFLISNFCHVLYVVCFLLGNPPVSEFYMPTFRNTLSVPSS